MKVQKAAVIEENLSCSGSAPENSGRVRRAKIVCTIGPACDSEEMIRNLMLAGMDVARLEKHC